MNWLTRIIIALIFLLIGAHIGAQWTLHELAPIIDQSFTILRGDHRMMMAGDYEALAGIHEGKNKKKAPSKKK